MDQRPGFLQRLRWGVGAVLGDETARRAQEADRRLGELERWLEYQDLATWQKDADALRRFGLRGAGGEATRLAAEMSEELGALRTGFPRGFQLAAAERWDQLRVDLDHLGERQRRYEAARGRLLDLSGQHLGAQQHVWQELDECVSCSRAEVLAEELAAAQDLPGLSKPDLTAYQQARDRVRDALPDDFVEGQGRICFNPDEGRAAVAELREQAPDAEQRASQYFYDALRGYETALGPEGTRRITEMLKDPAAVRRLREDHPGLFGAEPAGMGSMLPMFLMFYLLSAHSPGWSMPPPTAEAAGAQGPPLDDWLAGYDVPQPDALAQAAFEPDVFDAGDLWDGGGDGDADFSDGDFGGGDL